MSFEGHRARRRKLERTTSMTIRLARSSLYCMPIRTTDLANRSGAATTAAADKVRSGRPDQNPLQGVTLLERQPMLLALRAWRCEGLIGGFVQGADVDQQAHCACHQHIRQEVYDSLSPCRYQVWTVRAVLGRIGSAVAHSQTPRRRRTERR